MTDTEPTIAERIVQTLKTSPDPLSPKEIHAIVGGSYGYVRRLVADMARAGDLVTLPGSKYALRDHRTRPDDRVRPDDDPFTVRRMLDAAEEVGTDAARSGVSEPKAAYVIPGTVFENHLENGSVIRLRLVLEQDGPPLRGQGKLREET